MTMPGLNPKIEEIKKQVHQTSIHISRIPKNTKTEFMRLAEEEFENDFGMCLKWLLDFRKGLLSDPNQILSDRIDLLAEEVSKMKEVVAKPPPEKKRKMISGKEI